MSELFHQRKISLKTPQMASFQLVFGAQRGKMIQNFFLKSKDLRRVKTLIPICVAEVCFPYPINQMTFWRRLTRRLETVALMMLLKLVL